MSETTTDDLEGDDDIGRYVSAATALLGGWVVLSAFLLAPPAGNFWNDIVVGAAIGIISGYNALNADGPEDINTGGSALVALLGLWMVVAPFIFETPDATAFWSDVIVGALVAILAGYNTYQARSTERRTPTAEAEA